MGSLFTKSEAQFEGAGSAVEETARDARALSGRGHASSQDTEGKPRPGRRADGEQRAEAHDVVCGRREDDESEGARVGSGELGDDEDDSAFVRGAWDYV